MDYVKLFNAGGDLPSKLKENKKNPSHISQDAPELGGWSAPSCLPCLPNK